MDSEEFAKLTARCEKAEAALAEAQKRTEKAEADTDVRWKKKFEQAEAEIAALQGALRWACDELEKFALQNVDKESKKLWKRGGKLASATALLEGK